MTRPEESLELCLRRSLLKTHRPRFSNGVLGLGPQANTFSHPIEAMALLVSCPEAVKVAEEVESLKASYRVRVTTLCGRRLPYRGQHSNHALHLAHHDIHHVGIGLNLGDGVNE